MPQFRQRGSKVEVVDSQDRVVALFEQPADDNAPGGTTKSKGDLVIEADSAGAGVGDIILKTHGGTERARISNNGTFTGFPVSAAASQQWVNVAAAPYNADPTGATDSTAAFKSAIAAIDGVAKLGLYVPIGTYKINSTLFFPTVANVSKLGIYFEPGATLQWSDTGALTGGLGATQALLQVFTSDLDIWNPSIVGKSARGNGIGILYGSGPNLCKTTTATLNPGDTALAVSNGLLTYIRNGDFFNLVDTSGNVETCKLTAGEGTNNWTIVRAQRGTTALTFASGSYVQPPFFASGSNQNTQTEAYRCNTWSPYMSNLGVGIEFAIDEQGTGASGNSCGDNNVFGGYITACGTGILNRGFVNRGFGVTIASCNIGVDAGGPDYTNPGSGDSVTLRTSHKWEQHSFTMNQNRTCALWIRGGDGSLINGLWCENNGGQATQQVRIGQTVAVGGVAKTAYNTTGDGTWTLNADSSNPGDSVVKILNAAGTRIRHIRYSTNGGKVTTAVVMGDASLGVDSANRVTRINAWPGSANKNRMSDGTNLPAPWSNGSTNANSLIIQEHFETDPNSNAGSTIGDADFAPTPTATFTVFKETGNGVTTYYAKTQQGHLVLYATDTASTSGLKTVIEGIVADDCHIHFTAGRFHFIDAPLGTEAWANTQCGANISQHKGVMFTGEGMTKTILSTRSNTIQASPDLAIFLFTNCQRITIRDMQVEFCGAYMSTMEAFNFNQGVYCLVERVKFNRSKSTVLTFDGGDTGKVALGNIVRSCIFEGRPEPCEVDLITTGGTLTNGGTYQYAVSYRDADLGYFVNVTGASAGTTATLTFAQNHTFAVGDTITVQSMSVAGYNGQFVVASVPSSTTLTYTTVGSNIGAGTGGVVVGPADTKLSDPSLAFTTANGTSSAKVYLPIGPYTTLARKVHRWDGAAWKLVQTINDNTTLSWTDTNVAGTADSVPVSNRSNVPHAGVQLLAGQGSLIEGNILDGCGDADIVPAVAASPQAIRIATKASKSADNNRILGNRVRASGKTGIFVVGGSNNIIANNYVSNPGTVASKQQMVQIDTSGGIVSNNNLIVANRFVDDQGASSWQGGATTNNCINISQSSGATTGTLIANNSFSGNVSSDPISDGGTATVYGPNVGASAVKAKSAAYTATTFDSVIKATGGAGGITITLPDATLVAAGKQITIKKIDSGAGAVTVGTTSAQTIDASTTYSLATQWKYVTVCSDGANWQIVANN